ncbi:MAG: signal peptide peptidase SppA [Deltaproteobacteria bacterium]|nr:MAG: signal peptide peptidase SppA [Deltaproteobacteria bacterium]
MPVAVAALLLGLGPVLPAGAAEPVPERPELPAMPSAAEDGAAALWINPAALGMDPDPSGWLGLRLEPLGGPGTLSGALQRGPFATGVAYRLDGQQGNWLTVSTGLGVRLNPRIGAGVAFGWQIPEGPDDNFMTWDLGLAWRPAHWLGISLVAENLNDPAPDLGVVPRFGGGLAWRPLQGRVSLAVDYRQDSLDATAEGSFSGTLRLEPTDGMVVRASGDQDGRFGAGVELFWGRVGTGLHLDADGSALDAPATTVYALTADGSRNLLDTGRRLPEFVLDDDFPDQPRAGLFMEAGESWLHLLQRIEAAIHDPAVRGIVVHIDRPLGSLARVEELRGLLARARAAGRFTVAYLDQDAGTGAFMVAMAADRVYLHPAATLDVKGFALELTHMRETLDLVGIEPQFVQRSEYKSAPERFTRTRPSEPAREQLQALLDDATDALHEAIATGRGGLAGDIEVLIDAGPFTADEARRRGLVDRLVYPDQLEAVASEDAGRPLHLDPDYHLDDEVSGWPASREIAVVYVDGVITTGSSRGPGLLAGTIAGSDTIVRQLDQARRDDGVVAVVMRVDSPGGSAFASDEIWRATQRLRQAGKPLIVSMGGVAASGGYYVAAGADTIFAEPTTITGSIGVYGGKLSFGDLMDRLGLRTEIISRGRHAAMDSPSRPMDASELAALERLVDATYDQFKERVATGRGMPPDRVEELARGRVWSGRQAWQHGLVDELGGFDAAIAAARREAGLGDTAVVELVTYGDRDRGPLPQRSVRLAIAALGGRLGSPWEGTGVEPAVLGPLVADLDAWARLAGERTWTLLPWRVELR